MSEQGKKVVYEHIETDSETGEVKHQESVVRLPKEPDFIKVYLDCVCVFKGVSISLNPILMQLLSCATYASKGQKIYLNYELKKQIALNVGKTIKRIDQALKDFTQAGILKRIGVGTYQINPHIFGKGEWKDICNIRATFDFVEGTINAEFEKNDETESANTPICASDNKDKGTTIQEYMVNAGYFDEQN